MSLLGGTARYLLLRQVILSDAILLYPPAASGTRAGEYTRTCHQLMTHRSSCLTCRIVRYQHVELSSTPYNIASQPRTTPPSASPSAYHRTNLGQVECPRRPNPRQKIPTSVLTGVPCTNSSIVARRNLKGWHRDNVIIRAMVWGDRMAVKRVLLEFIPESCTWPPCFYIPSGWIAYCVCRGFNTHTYMESLLYRRCSCGSSREVDNSPDDVALQKNTYATSDYFSLSH